MSGDVLTGLDGVPLFRHSRREQWGLAILALEEGDRRRYQFEDGRMRTFKKGYWHLLVEVQKTAEETRTIVGDLISKLDVSQARRELVAEARSAGKDVITLDDQVAIFRHLYPGGFTDEQWASNFRGDLEGRRLKRHREAAIIAFQAGLTVEERAEVRSQGGSLAVLQRVHDLLKSTDLIRRQDLEALVAIIDDGDPDPAATAIEQILDGADHLTSYSAWIEALGPTATWALVTVPAALAMPNTHIPVKPSTFKAQAKWLAPRLEISSEVKASVYVDILGMTANLREGLTARELTPRDFIDIHDFVVQSLRPSSIKAWRGGH